MKANSYKRSAQEEFHKYNDLLNFLNKLKQEKIISQKNFKLNLDKYYCLKDEHSKLIQITEFQHQNLCNVISVRIIKLKWTLILNINCYIVLNLI